MRQLIQLCVITALFSQNFAQDTTYTLADFNTNLFWKRPSQGKHAYCSNKNRIHAAEYEYFVGECYWQ